jgi:cytoskeletal protein RodZ
MEVMAGFGEELRKERESRGIRLDQIIQTTKISSRHLKALEEDNFGMLPGGVFNKGIVRSYARVVGLDEEDCINRFMNAYRASGEMLEDDANWTTFAENIGRTRDPERRRLITRLRWAGVVALLLALVLSGVFTYNWLADREGWSPIKSPHLAFHLHLPS